MRLADFILANLKPILAEWELFACQIWPSPAGGAGSEAPDSAELRDHAEDVLRAAVSDMQSDQTAAQQSDKSKGEGRARAGGDLDEASELHGSGRAVSGFDISAVFAEYRALRASVLRLWRESRPAPDLDDLDDLTRFNESIDQSLSRSIHTFVDQIEFGRAALLAREQAARTEADTANRAKDLFLATLSHEIRTPLTAIVGWMSFLRSKVYQDKDLNQGLEVIDRNTRLQVKLIDELMDVSRIVSGKLNLEIRSCDLARVVNAGVDGVRPAAEARGITVAVRLDPTANHTSCDEARMQQVVSNLISNAVKFTPEGGRVGVTLVRQESCMQIEVSDNGEGIDPELLPYIFDRFRQAHTSTRRRFGGLGLGLSIVKQLVEAHGGTVEARSAGVGKGSTFTVRLPIRAVRIDERGEEATPHRAGESVPEAPRFSPVRLDGLRVLVVVDELDACRLLVKVLNGVGAVVSAAGSAREALEALDKAREGRRPDVLVSDLAMPGEDGFELIRQVRAHGHHARELPAVALTGLVHEDEARQAIKAGFQVHVPKPVDLQHLTLVIETLAARPRGVGQLTSHGNDNGG